MKLGVIGGSGLYEIPEFKGAEACEIDTPYGSPSGVFTTGRIEGRDVVFLPRHGKGHKVLPSEINHRANIYGFKSLETDVVVSFSAVGSLKEKLRPGDVVLPDQYFDRTKRSAEHTFFGDGAVAHISFGEPSCTDLRNLLFSLSESVICESDEYADVRANNGGTYVNMEGPAFSTKAESSFYRQLGFDVIGMTSLAEAKLCREAGMCYQAVAMVTDYDCWHETEESVTVEAIIKQLIANTELARRILVRLAGDLPNQNNCNCAEALKDAIITRKEDIPEQTLDRLKVIAGKYL